MFIKDIKGYQLPADAFYPRPITHLADFDADNDLWALVMEDAGVYADQKVHESELPFDETMRMIPGLVDVAVAWEGADHGDKAAQLDELGVALWSSEENLNNFKALMPGGVKLFDRLTMMAESPLVGTPTLDACLGGPGFAETFARRSDAFFPPRTRTMARPARSRTAICAAITSSSAMATPAIPAAGCALTFSRCSGGRCRRIWLI